MVALSLAGSAILLYSCAEPEAEENPAATETLQTEYSENLSIVESLNGRRSYHFETPLLEGYTLAREPYREFRKGIKITTYQDDSLSTVDAVLTANYAIYYENRKLWEAKGNVVVTKSDGKTLYTQQLFWNALTKKIYSNVDSKIVQNEGRDVFIGEGFESDEEFKDWRFRRMKGRMEVDVTPGNGRDSVGGARSAAAADPNRKPVADRNPSADRQSAATRQSGGARRPEAAASKRPAPARSRRPASPPSAPADLASPALLRPDASVRSEALQEEAVRRVTNAPEGAARQSDEPLKPQGAALPRSERVTAQPNREELPRSERVTAEPDRGKLPYSEKVTTEPDRGELPRSDKATAQPDRGAVPMDGTAAEPEGALRTNERVAAPHEASRADKRAE